MHPIKLPCDFGEIPGVTFVADNDGALVVHLTTGVTLIVERAKCPEVSVLELFDVTLQPFNPMSREVVARGLAANAVVDLLAQEAGKAAGKQPEEAPSSNDRSEIDLPDVLKSRVVAGQPIFVVGNPQGVVAEAIDATHRRLAEEAGMPVQVVQVVELPN